MSKRLIETERVNGLLHRWYRHDDTKVTVETEQDVEPVFRSIEQRVDMESPRSGFRLKAEIPMTVMMEKCKEYATKGGITTSEMYKEAMIGKTDRAQKLWRELTQERDFSRLQAQTYR